MSCTDVLQTQNKLCLEIGAGEKNLNMARVTRGFMTRVPRRHAEIGAATHSTVVFKRQESKIFVAGRFYEHLFNGSIHQLRTPWVGGEEGKSNATANNKETDALPHAVRPAPLSVWHPDRQPCPIFHEGFHA